MFDWIKEKVFGALLAKLNQRELWVSAAGALAMVFAPKLGIPEDKLEAFFESIAAIVAAYAVSRGIHKAGEAKAGATPDTVPAPAP